MFFFDQMEYHTELKKKPLSERQDQATKIMKKFFPKLPVIIDRCNKTDPMIEKNKYLIEPDTSISTIITIIRKRVKIDAYQNIFVFIDNEVPNANHTIGEIYHKKALLSNHDGFLYLNYSIENTFG